MQTTAATVTGPKGAWFSAALAIALFFAIWGAKLAVIDRFGSDLPFWDQWAREGDQLYTAWLERGEFRRNLFSPHNEHRIAPTLAMNLALVAVSGQWDARVQCVLSAALHAAVLAGLFLWASRRFSPRRTVAVGALIALVGAAPISWENLLSGFQSQFYFLAGFSLLAIGGLLLNPAFSLRWWSGFAAGLVALVSMGSGLLCAVPIFAIAGVRLVTSYPSRRDAIAAVVAACLLIGIGVSLHTNVPGHATLRAPNAVAFLSYAAHCLSWPLVNHAWLGLLLWLPWFVLVARWTKDLARRDGGAIANRATHDFILAGGIWVLAQVAAVSYSRGGSGELPANRYGDLLGIGLVFSSCALAVAGTYLAKSRFIRPVWAAVVAACLLMGTRTAWNASLPTKKADHLAYENSVRTFVVTDDLAWFAKQPLPFPNSDWLARILRHSRLRVILPASVRPPVRIANFDHHEDDAMPRLLHRATRTLADRDEWRSEPLPAGRGWWRIETAGNLGSPGTSFELVAVPDGRLLSSISPPEPSGKAWRSTFIPAPREPAQWMARSDGPANAFVFSEPVEVSSLSYRAWQLCRLGPLICGLAVVTGVGLGASLWPGRSRRSAGPPDNSL